MTGGHYDSAPWMTRIVQKTGLGPEKIRDVIFLYLAEVHRITIVDEKGPTAAVMETCFSFGADAAFHLIGLYASEHQYHGRDDAAWAWSEVAMRFIPQAHQEGGERIASWFAEQTPARVSLDEDIRARPMTREITCSKPTLPEDPSKSLKEAEDLRTKLTRKPPTDAEMEEMSSRHFLEAVEKAKEVLRQRKG